MAGLFERSKQKSTGTVAQTAAPAKEAIARLYLRMLAAGPIRGLPLGEIDAALSQPGAFNTSATQNTVTDPSSPSLFEQGGSALTTILVLKSLLGGDKDSEGSGMSDLVKLLGGKLGLKGLGGDVSSSALGQVDPDLWSKISSVGSGADLSQAEQALMFPSDSSLYSHGNVPSSFETDSGWFDNLPILSFLSRFG